MTFGEKINNPGNIRTVAGTTWKGITSVQPHNGFVQFISPQYGIRAIYRILASYERQGLTTLGEAIDRWAPPNENNSEAYIVDVCARCEVNPDTPISLTAIAPRIIKAIIFHENGECIYSDEVIAQGIALA